MPPLISRLKTSGREPRTASWITTTTQPRPVRGGFEITDTPKQTRAVPCRLFKGDGTGHFTNVTEAAGLQVEPRAATAVAFCDFDNDGFVDIYVANSRSPNWLWHNQGDGTFKDVAEEAGATGGAGSSRAVAVADYDNDGDFDVFVVNYAHDDPKKSQPRSMLLRNDSSPDGGLRFTDVTAECALAWEPPEGYKAEATWQSAVWADLNNDGWLDLFVTESADDGKNHPHAPLKYGKLDSGYSKLWLGQGGQSFVRVDKERNKLRIEDSAVSPRAISIMTAVRLLSVPIPARSQTRSIGLTDQDADDAPADGAWATGCGKRRLLESRS